MSEPLESERGQTGARAGSDPGQGGVRAGSDPGLAVVIASVNGMPYLGRCLDALAEHCPQAEIVVADWTNDATRAAASSKASGCSFSTRCAHA